MILDDTAAAYGLFQVVFADLADDLAIATFRLREQKEPGLVFESVFRQEFKKTLKQFRQELDQFENRAAVANNLYAVREALKAIVNLATWRNERIHARVHMTEHGYALYNWQTRRRLEISTETIKQNIELAIKAKVELAAHAKDLIRLLNWDDEFEKLFGALPELLESDDTQPENDKT